MNTILKDAWGDRSSGILMMICLFVAAVVTANLGVILGADIAQLAVIVGVFLAPVAGGQIGQALQGQPPATGQGDEVQGPVGLFQNPSGKFDVGRLLKFIAVVVAVELVVLTLVVRKDLTLIGSSALCIPFVTYAVTSEITQKAAGV